MEQVSSANGIEQSNQLSTQDVLKLVDERLVKMGTKEGNIPELVNRAIEIVEKSAEAIKKFPVGKIHTKKPAETGEAFGKLKADLKSLSPEGKQVLGRDFLLFTLMFRQEKLGKQELAEKNYSASSEMVGLAVENGSVDVDTYSAWEAVMRGIVYRKATDGRLDPYIKEYKTPNRVRLTRNVLAKSGRFTANQQEIGMLVDKWLEK